MTAPTSFRIVHAAENIKGGVGTYLRDLVVAQRASFGDGAVIVVVPRSQSDILESPTGVEVITFDDRGPRWRSTLRLAARMREVMARVDATSQREPLTETVSFGAAATPATGALLSQASLLSTSSARRCVVHLHSTFAGLALRPLLRWAPGRRRASTQRNHAPVVVYCAHGWSFDRETSAASRQLAMALERTLAPMCDAVVCISKHEMRLARQARLAPPAIAHIANGIPCQAPVAATTPRPEWPNDKRRVLFVGRFDRQKGVDILIEALRELRDSTFAYLAGSAVLGDGASLNLPDNACTTGWLSAADLTAYYESADVLVAPSRWEGFGLTAVEAMRSGLPVIAARVGGLAEVVEHGVTGLLVEPNNSAALVHAIRSTRPEALETMGQAGRQRFAEHFTLDRMHTQLTALYQRLCAAKLAAPEGSLREARPPREPHEPRHPQPEGSPNA